MTPDMINGSFELMGAFFLLLNVRQLYKDKGLNGVHWAPTVLFSCWGLWNLYFYPHLGQWYSFAGGLAIVCVNTFWLGQIAWYVKVKPVLVKSREGNING
jgi:hypothetical protein